MIIKLLLRYGADVSLLTHRGESPIDLAHSGDVLKLVAPNGMCIKVYYYKQLA